MKYKYGLYYEGFDYKEFEIVVLAPPGEGKFAIGKARKLAKEYGYENIGFRLLGIEEMIE